MRAPAVALVLALTPLVQFPGSGGPGGNFDWVIGNDLPGPPYQTVVLDTAFSVITNDSQTAQETVIRGRVDVRDMIVKANGILLVEGPSGLFVTATGTIRIDGAIIAKGLNNRGVSTLNTTSLREPGASGGPGGGRGGDGNGRTRQSSPKGENGYGAFSVSNFGGEGGESGYQPGFPNDSDDEHRRPAGGGGGRFGHDFLRPAGIAQGYVNPNECPDQGEIGFDAEAGFAGYPGDTAYVGAVGVITGLTPPQGGRPGPGPFSDADPSNDFWGTMSSGSGAVIQGELQIPWAGSGGGGGGNAINSSSFPTTPFDPTGDEKGSGGGGGGGSVTILALGDIRFGPHGRIDASGGTGGGGENSIQTGGVTHIGGGSGGGSGGHVILESSTRIDFSECITTSSPPAGIRALGGEGGAGKNDRGGARVGVAMPPNHDVLPTDSYPSSTSPCGVEAGQAGYAFTNLVGDPGAGSDFPLGVICAGGDGGPGIIQLHTPSPNDVIPPFSPGESIYKLIQPPPVSSLPPTGVASYRKLNDPRTWNTMFLSYGVRGMSVSGWTRAVSGAEALPLPAIVGVGRGSGADRRTLAIDAMAVEDLYLRHPLLLVGADVRVGGGGPDRVLESKRDEDTGELRLVLEASSDLGEDLRVEIRPRLGRSAARSIDGRLPRDLRARFEVQVAPEAIGGGPDIARASAWTDAFAVERPDGGYLRVRVSVVPRETPAAPEPGTPTSDFLRVRLGF
jgi:hypothetical protein